MGARPVVLAAALAVSACAPQMVAAPRLPDAALLSACIDPVLVEDPATANDNEVAGERIRVAEAYMTCKRKQADLARFVRGK